MIISGITLRVEAFFSLFSKSSVVTELVSLAENVNQDWRRLLSHAYICTCTIALISPFSLPLLHRFPLSCNKILTFSLGSHQAWAALLWLSYLTFQFVLGWRQKGGWADIAVAGIKKCSPSSSRYLGALQRPCGTTGSCLEGQILACTRNLKWQFLLAVNLTRRRFSSDLTVCRDYFLLCHCLPVAQFFIGLCSTSVKFQINFIIC